jgi:FYVE zinc finger
MFKLFAGGWDAVTPVPDVDSAITNGGNKYQVAPIITSASEDEKEDEIAKEMLVQFPAYGTRSQAQNSNLNPTADWLLGGTPNIPSQQQLLMKQMQQQMQQEEENALQDEKQIKTNASKEPVFVIRDWDNDERKLWKSAPAKDLHKREIYPKEIASEQKNDTSSTTLQFEDPSKDWIYAYYYHTGVKPRIETSTPHPMFDRGPTNGLPKSLPRSAFSGYDSIKALNVTVPGLVHDEMDWYEQYDGIHPGTQKSTGDAVAKSREDRQHWMPDRLCKHCYACDTQFTVFRRRHHCRICGQVFCNNCSGFFVPSRPNENPDTKTILRACKMCFEQVSEKRLIEEEEDLRKRRKNSEAVAGPMASPVQNPAGGSSPLLQQSLNQEDSVLTSLSKKQNLIQQKSLHSQEEALERDEREQATLIMHSISEQERLDVHQETRALGSPDRAFHKRLLVQLESKENSETPNGSTAVEEGNRHLGLTAAIHLEEMGKALLASDAPLLYSELCQQTKEPSKLYDKWLEQLMILATRCCATVEPNVKKGDLLDIRPYVKVKGTLWWAHSICTACRSNQLTVSHQNFASHTRGHNQGLRLY